MYEDDIGDIATIQHDHDYNLLHTTNDTNDNSYITLLSTEQNHDFHTIDNNIASTLTTQHSFGILHYEYDNEVKIWKSKTEIEFLHRFFKKSCFYSKMRVLTIHSTSHRFSHLDPHPILIK